MLNECFSINECRVYKLVHILDTSRCNFTPFLATSTKEFCEKNIFECLPNSTEKCIVVDVNYSIITKKSIILIVRNYEHVSFYQARYTRAHFMF